MVRMFWPASLATRLETARRRAGGAVLRYTLEGLSRLGKLHPQASPERHGVEVHRNLAYAESGHEAHLFDIYRPRGRHGPLPVVLYVHGGAFRILSKDTHWLMGLAFARRGYLVFNINYRLAPEHRFPAALEDAAAAYVWVKRHAAEWGGDPERIALAGESAGANLVTSLAVCASYRRPEPWARRVFEADPRPRAVVAACGMLQVSDPGRFWRRRRLPRWVQDRLEETSRGYLPKQARPEESELADPLLLLERAAPPERPLPPFFAPCGTRDPLLDDTRRLERALARLGVPCEAPIYPGEPHAFHALVWRKEARACWRAKFAFLERHVTP